MPREIVGSDVGPFVVKVGWAADRDVQVGVEGDEGRSLNWLLYGTDLPWLGDQVRKLTAVTYENDEALGRALLNTLDVFPGSVSDGQGYRGVWATLDRQGCNRLVRLVRRARDSAFGADA